MNFMNATEHRGAQDGEDADELLEMRYQAHRARQDLEDLLFGESPQNDWIAAQDVAA
jgi:hypothetical protein